MSTEFRHRVSILLNIVLACAIGTIVLQKARRKPAPPPIETRHEETSRNVGTARDAAAVSRAVPRPRLPRYSEIESPADRRRAIIDRLRAAGVPNELLGRVAKVDFEVQWDSRFEENWGDPDKLAAVQVEMNLSKDAEMRAALGEADFKQWDQEYMLWEAMSTKVDVTAREAEALYGFKKRLQQRMLELDEARLKGSMDDAEINGAVDEAYAAFNEEMRRLLGDERYAKSQQVDEAFLADNFRHQLAKANPTETQFRALFKVESDWNRARMEVEQQFQNDTFSPAYLEKLKALDAARDEEFRRVLGADAFTLLQKNQDPAYVQMKKFERLWGLDDDKIDYVYGVMKEYHDTVQSFQTEVLALNARGQSVDADAVGRKLQQSALRAQQALESRLGWDSFDKLQRNRVLRWATLASRPAMGSR